MEASSFYVDMNLKQKLILSEFKISPPTLDGVLIVRLDLNC
jgi:hypothetical protein